MSILFSSGMGAKLMQQHVAMMLKMVGRPLWSGLVSSEFGTPKWAMVEMAR